MIFRRLGAAAVAAATLAFASPAFAVTEIQWWHAMTGANNDVIVKLATDFNASQSDYKVIPTYKGGYADTMNAGIAAFRAGNAPHIMQVFEVGTATMMAATGAVKPVYKLMADAGEKFDPSVYLPAITGYYSTSKGEMLSFPFNSSSTVMWVNLDALKKANIAEIPKTWPQVFEDAKKLKAAGKPAGFALGNAVGDGNGFANWLLWSHNAALLDEEGNIIINSRETIAALKYLKELYPTFIAGTPSWNDVSNNRAYSSQEIGLTANGVSLYFSLKNDPATKAVADDTEHQFLPKGLASTSPMSGLTLNAMVFKHSPYPNAAKALLQFMLEKEQYEPWLNANSGYWSQPLAAYANAAVWSSDPKVAIFKDTMRSPYYNGYKGPISTATGAVNADYVLVQMCASVATDAAKPEAAAAEAEQRAKRYFRRQGR